MIIESLVARAIVFMINTSNNIKFDLATVSQLNSDELLARPNQPTEATQLL